MQIWRVRLQVVQQKKQSCYITVASLTNTNFDADKIRLRNTDINREGNKVKRVELQVVQQRQTELQLWCTARG